MTDIAFTERSAGRLVLRPFRGADRDEYVRVLRVSADAWAPWTPSSDPALSAEARFEHELARGENGRRTGSHLRLAAFAGASLVGLFGLNEIVRGVFQSAYASWQVSADALRRGYGTEGVRALLRIAFDPPTAGLGLHRVQANIMPSNVPSLHIAARVGFREEGFAHRYLRIAGHWEDHVMHAVTREEWSDA